MKYYDVSIIVTTHNEAENIANCLASIDKQKHPRDKIEVIVVDNNSTDRTKNIAKRYTEKVYNYGPERSAQRNFGIEEASGKYILYLDADMILSEDIVSQSFNTCEKQNLIALYIPEEIVGQGFWIKVRNFERSFYNSTAIDCVRFVRRDKFFEIGGFDETLTGPEDWDFNRRILVVGKVGIITSPIYHNEGRFTYGRYLGKKSYYAKSFDKYIQKWGEGDPIIKKQLGFWYRFFGVFIENGKWQRLLTHPLLSVGLYILRFSVGLTYVLDNNKDFVTRKGVLIICPFFRPNIGGVETHLNDLCEYLRKDGWYVYVITYQPLTTKGKGPPLERSENLEIRRIRWFGFNLFHKLERVPLLEFLYLTPRLLAEVFLFLVFNGKKIVVIHAHGFNSAFIARAVSPFFKKRTVVSTHAIYGLKPGSPFSKILKWTLNGFDRVLCVSPPSMDELLKIGVEREEVRLYAYWVDQEIFRPLDKASFKRRLGWSDRFVVLFVGRFISKKGIYLLLEAARHINKNIYFAFIGDGPLASEIEAASRRYKNVIFIGAVDNTMLPGYYNAAELLCVPSLYAEGFGRVIAEALSCGLPVMASKRGGIPAIMNEGVGFLIEPELSCIIGCLNEIYADSTRLKGLSQNCRDFAVHHFGIGNAGLMTDSYI